MRFWVYLLLAFAPLILPGQDLPQSLPSIPWKLSPRDWRPTGLRNDQLLDSLERGARAMARLQDAGLQLAADMIGRSDRQPVPDHEKSPLQGHRSTPSHCQFLTAGRRQASRVVDRSRHSFNRLERRRG